MKFKKFSALILALVMALSLAVPAFAEGEGGGSSGNTATATTQNVAITGSTKSGAIEITVGPTGALMLNPYQLKATITNVGDSYHQIFHKAVPCKNKSTFALTVDATVTGTPTEGVTLVNAAPAFTVEDKQVFLYAEFGVNTSDTVEPTWQTAYNAKNANQVLATQVAQGATATPKELVASLPATNGTDAGANYLWYKFDGAATKKPKVAWTENDKVNATIALTLKSVVSDVYAIAVTNTTSAAAKGTATLNYDVAPAGETITLTVTSDLLVASKATVTAKAGSANITFATSSTGPSAANGCGTYVFEMPASAVTITVKWAAA